VWDYTAKALKLAFFPYAVAKQIAALEKSEDYAFSGVPMPYDITVDATNAGTKEVEYKVIPARNDSDVPSEATAALAKQKPIDDVKHLIMDQQSHSATASTSGSNEEITGEDLPF
jgi:hypothetical protein